MPPAALKPGLVLQILLVNQRSTQKNLLWLLSDCKLLNPPESYHNNVSPRGNLTPRAPCRHRRACIRSHLAWQLQTQQVREKDDQTSKKCGVRLAAAAELGLTQSLSRSVTARQRLSKPQLHSPLPCQCEWERRGRAVVAMEMHLLPGLICAGHSRCPFVWKPLGCLHSNMAVYHSDCWLSASTRFFMSPPVSLFICLPLPLHASVSFGIK